MPRVRFIRRFCALLTCGAFTGSVGCSKQAAAPPPEAAPVASLHSQIDSDPRMTPEQKAMMKQKLSQSQGKAVPNGP